MVSTFTPNIQLEEPARGDDVGTWDTPVNANMTLLDLTIGADTTIGLGSGNVTLSAGQFRSATLTFNSTLVQNTMITFPTSFIKPYLVGHLCTGSSAFTIALQTTAAGGQVIAIPPGEYISVFNDGTNLKFANLERVGAFWDYGGSSVPGWVGTCTVQPYLNCDGTTFSSATFPQLTVLLGGTTLPDLRGVSRYTLNQGTGRLTTALGGLDGTTNFSIKTTQATISTSNLPAYTPSGTFITSQVNVPFNAVPFNGQRTDGNGTGLVGANDASTPISVGQLSGNISGNAQGGVSNVMPVGSATVAGITMIRAA